jgi:hypothetical protein
MGKDGKESGPYPTTGNGSRVKQTMNFQFDVSQFLVSPPPVTEPPPTPPSEAVDLLRQLLEVQREQLNYARAAAAAHDSVSRWRAFLSRWQNEFPYLGEDCRKALPLLERTYGKLIADLGAQLREEGDGALDTDFALQEFLDRYGMKLAQLGTILNLVAPLAEACPPPESI